MKRPKVFGGDGVHSGMNTGLATVLEEIALGEADLDAASEAIATAVACLDESLAAKLYESLRSFVWKALDARRRDAELSIWLDIVGRVSSSVADLDKELATKLEACAEFLHISIARASAPSERMFERKHVRDVVAALLRSGGTLRKRDLLAATKLKEANLARILAPLRDAGWVARSMDGKEAVYRITEVGREAAPPELRPVGAAALGDAGARLTNQFQFYPNHLMVAGAAVKRSGGRKGSAGTGFPREGRPKREEELPMGFQYTDLVHSYLVNHIVGPHPARGDHGDWERDYVGRCQAGAVRQPRARVGQGRR